MASSSVSRTSKMPANLFNLENMCRTCCSVGDLESLYDNFETTSTIDICFAEMLMLCTPVEYYNEDDLPKHICQDCIQELLRSYSFALRCKESNEKWQDCVNSINQLKKQSIANQEIKREPDTINYDTQNEQTIEPETDDIKIECDEITTYEYRTDELNTLQTSRFPVVLLNKLQNNEPELNYIDKINSQVSTDDDRQSTQTIEKYDFRNRNQPNLSINYCETYESDDECNPIKNKPKSKTTNHFKNVTRCYICLRVFNTKAGLAKHQQVHPKMPFQCSECPRLFHTEANVKRHFNIHDGRQLYLCTICKNPFSNNGNLITHMRTHSIYKRSFKNDDQKHMRKRRCTSVTAHSRNGGLVSNAKITQNARTFRQGGHKCTLCNYMSLHRANVNRHIQGKHLIGSSSGSGSFTCSLCNLTFLNMSLLKKHIYIHVQDKQPFPCHACHRSFKLQTGLNYHVKRCVNILNK